METTDLIRKQIVPEVAPQPSLEQKKKKRKKSSKLGRQIQFLARASTRPLIGKIPLGSYDYLFLVYPGTDNDLKGYCPPRLAKSTLFYSKPTPAGIIEANGVVGRGLYLVIPNTTQDLISNKASCKMVARRLERACGAFNARSIAIAGQGPSIFQRHGITIEKPFVQGYKGTVFAVLETLNEAVKAHGLTPGCFKTSIVGVGLIGSNLMSVLREEGHEVVGVDINKNGGDVVLAENAEDVLSTSRVVIVLTPKGKDFDPYLKWLLPGSIVIDDTHPKIINKPKDMHFYKVAVGLLKKDGGLARFNPHLPGYKPEWFPGCSIEAVVSASQCVFNGDISQGEFNRLAKKIGFFTFMTN